MPSGFSGLDVPTPQREPWDERIWNLEWDGLDPYAAARRVLSEAPRPSPTREWMRRNPHYYPYVPGDAGPDVEPLPRGGGEGGSRGAPDQQIQAAQPGIPSRKPGAEMAWERLARYARLVRPDLFEDAPDEEAGTPRPPNDIALAQFMRRSRRAGSGIMVPGGRELTIPEQLRWDFWNLGQRTLRELNPGNPMLENLYGPNWVPDETRDLKPLWDEIRRLRREQKLRELELHHPLPNQHARQFQANGITDLFRERNGYYMWQQEHRGRGGLHPRWNRDWSRFFDEYERPGDTGILDHLQQMMRAYGQSGR
jgi:hypothetical protein